MTAIAFDTHAFVKRLTSAGMPEAQAEILASAQAELIDEKLATKADLAQLERALKADQAQVERALKADLAALKADLVQTERGLKVDIERLKLSLQGDMELQKRDLKIWFGSVLVAAVGVLLAAIRYLPAPHP